MPVDDNSPVIAGLPNVQAPLAQNTSGVRRIFDEAHREPRAAQPEPTDSIVAAPIARDWFRMATGILMSAVLLYLAFQSLSQVGKIEQLSVDSASSREISLPGQETELVADADPLKAIGTDHPILNEARESADALSDRLIELPERPHPRMSHLTDPLEGRSSQSLDELPNYPTTGFPRPDELTQLAPITEEASELYLPPMTVEFETPHVAQLPTTPSRPVEISLPIPNELLPPEAEIQTSEPVFSESPAIETAQTVSPEVQLRGTIEKYPNAN